MASISSLSSSGSTNSIYGNRNVISGLASGIDTESLIENAVTGYKTRITSLEQDRTMVEWEQEAYRSIITQMYNFTNKYASFTSATNLLSTSFFTGGVSTTPQGANAASVSAGGSTGSDVAINAIKQLAKGATYKVSGSKLSGGATGTITSNEAIDLSSDARVSTIKGTLTLNYGNKTVGVNFEENEIYESAEELAAAINEKLASEKITTDSGNTYDADELIKATVQDGKVVFEDLSGAGNGVSIARASGDLGKTLGISADDTSIAVDKKSLYKTVDHGAYLEGKTMNFTYNGVSKSITLGKFDNADDFIADVQKKLDDAFGAGKITVGNAASDDKLQITFDAGSNNKLAVSSAAGERLGIGESATSYFSTAKTLEQLGVLDGLTAEGEGENKGKYAFKVNDEVVGYYDKESTIADILKDMKAAGYTANYSSVVDQFTFTSSETGEASNFAFGDGLAQKLFGSKGDEGVTFEEGQDAVFEMTVDGVTQEFTRSSNTIDIDGLSVTLKDEFGYAADGSRVETEAITFKSETDTSNVVDTVKTFVEEYNSLLKSIKEAYSTAPAEKSSKTHEKYRPLTDEDKEGMSESTIENYEKRAKQGILFGDNDLSALYNGLRNIVNENSTALEKIGITVSYNSGLTSLSLNEAKLTESIEKDPEAVAHVFTGDGKTKGLMTSMKGTLDAYGSTTGAVKGILVAKAGATESSLSQLSNTLLDKLNDIDDEIGEWETKLSEKIDYYSKQFTRLEQLINDMNSQSSALAGLSGGY